MKKKGQKMTFNNHDEKRAFGLLMRSIQKLVFADGKVDIKEVKLMIGLVKPFANRDEELSKFLSVLIDVSADGIVEPSESKLLERLIEQLAKQYSEF